MRKLLIGIGILLGGLVGLIVIAFAAIVLITNARVNQTYDVTPATVAIPTDAESLARGQYLAETRGCTDCHNENLAGGEFVNDPAFGLLHATNLTPGEGGLGSYSDLDLLRAIRHGVRPDGKSVLVMPSQEFYFLSDADLGALIAYLRTVPPVDNVNPPNRMGPLVRVLYLAGQLPLLPAEIIDHDAPRPIAPEPGVTAEYGGYVAIGCTGCHGLDFVGGPIPGAEPGTPPAPNLTPGGELGGWTEEDFIIALRTGVTPTGRELDPAYMPWPVTARMTDDELKAMWLYLQTLPAK